MVLTAKTPPPEPPAEPAKGPLDDVDDEALIARLRRLPGLGDVLGTPKPAPTPTPVPAEPSGLADQIELGLRRALGHGADKASSAAPSAGPPPAPAKEPTLRERLWGRHG